MSETSDRSLLARTLAHIGVEESMDTESLDDGDSRDAMSTFSAAPSSISESGSVLSSLFEFPYPRRQMNSLRLIAQKLVQHLAQSDGIDININDILDDPAFRGVSRRRIYDVTNIMEGVGLLRNLGRQRFRWSGPRDIDYLPKFKVDSSRRQAERLDEIENELAEAVKIAKQNRELLLSSSTFHRYGYLHVNDLMDLMDNEPMGCVFVAPKRGLNSVNTTEVLSCKEDHTTPQRTLQVYAPSKYVLGFKCPQFTNVELILEDREVGDTDMVENHRDREYVRRAISPPPKYRMPINKYTTLDELFNTEL